MASSLLACSESGELFATLFRESSPLHRLAQVISMVPPCSWGGRFAILLGATDKVKAVVVNHGSFVKQEDIDAIKVPLLLNAADNDRQISREMLAQFQGVLECKKDVPSDVKVLTGLPVVLKYGSGKTIIVYKNQT